MTSPRPTGLRALLAVVILSLAALPARADDSVGVVVTGETMLQPQLVAQLETWLRMHGHELTSTPLPPDAVSALIDCFVIEDQSCARSVVDKRSQASSIVFGQINVATNSTTSDRSITLTLYWLEKGSDPRTERRPCERCTEVTLRKIADELMVALTGDDTPRGRVKLGSRPKGAKVSIGGKVVGETPLVDRLPPGEHTVTFELTGRPPQTRNITVEQGQTQSVSVSFEPKLPMSTRQKLGYTGLAGGVALAVGGGVLWSFDEDQDPPEGRQEHAKYFDTAPYAIGMIAVGAVAMGTGVYLLVTDSSPKSTPAVGLVPGGGVIGWAGRF